MKGLCGDFERLETYRKNSLTPWQKPNPCYIVSIEEHYKNSSKKLTKCRPLRIEHPRSARRFPQLVVRWKQMEVIGITAHGAAEEALKAAGLEQEAFRKKDKPENWNKGFVEDWLRRTRNTVYLKQQMVVVYVEQYWEGSLLLLFWWWPVYKRIGY